MGSIPTTPSESARHTSASLGVAALKGLPTLFRVGPGVLRPVSDSGGTYELAAKPALTAAAILSGKSINAPLDHFRMAI